MDGNFPGGEDFTGGNFPRQILISDLAESMIMTNRLKPLLH